MSVISPISPQPNGTVGLPESIKPIQRPIPPTPVNASPVTLPPTASTNATNQTGTVGTVVNTSG
ncbi:MAG: hypothetical protein QOJ54_1889 [Aliidongia sp.]|nr:hypothetical protein [Aliidongia sp.]